MSAALKISAPTKRGTGASRRQLSMIRATKSFQWGDGVGTAVKPTNTARLKSDVWTPLPDTNPVTVLEHREGMCRWPVAETPFLYCGCDVDDSSRNYCTRHLGLSQASADSPATVPDYDLRNLERMFTK